MAHDEPPHQDLHCLQIQLFSSLVVKELNILLACSSSFIILSKPYQEVGNNSRKSCDVSIKVIVYGSLYSLFHDNRDFIVPVFIPMDFMICLGKSVLKCRKGVHCI